MIDLLIYDSWVDLINLNIVCYNILDWINIFIVKAWPSSDSLGD